MIAFAPGQEGKPLRSTEEIAASYDAQARSSYVTKLRNPFFARYGRAVGRKLAELKPLSLLDVGTGDGYTLSYALEEVRVPAVFGVDASKERLRIAESILGPRNVTFIQADLFKLPLGDGAFDVVLTSHALEPNGGREVEGIRELHRVARRYVLMIEPDYDAAPPAGKQRMQRLGYVSNILEAIELLGLELHEYEEFPEIGNPLNPSSCFLIRKAGNA
jgi:ubiquinone/menaquinone biosynthesis C-methylase UbiE